MSESSSANPQQTPGLFEDRVDPSTTTTPNSPSRTQPPNIPAQVLQKACEALKRNILPHDDDSEIRDNLGHVWVAVKRALEHDQNRKGCLANNNQFLANVTRKGEQQFIHSLRSMAIRGIWAALFDDDVFLTEKPRIHQQKAPDIVAVKSRNRTRVQRQCLPCASTDYIKLSRQGATALFETNIYYKFIWHRKVSYGRRNF